MRKLAKLAVLGFCYAATIAQAAPLWDGVVEASAVSVGPGRWLVCPPGTRYDGEYKVPTNRCREPGVLASSAAGEPQEVDLDGLLARYVRPPAGYRVEAVGPLPFLQCGGGKSVTCNIAPNAIWLAYRIILKR